MSDQSVCMCLFDFAITLHKRTHSQTHTHTHMSKQLNENSTSYSCLRLYSVSHLTFPLRSRRHRFRRRRH